MPACLPDACPPSCLGLLQSAPSKPGALSRAGREPRPVPAGRGSTGRAGRLQAGPTAVPTLPGWRRRGMRKRRSGVELAETTPTAGPAGAAAGTLSCPCCHPPSASASMQPEVGVRPCPLFPRHPDIPLCSVPMSHQGLCPAGCWAGCSVPAWLCSQRPAHAQWALPAHTVGTKAGS